MRSLEYAPARWLAAILISLGATLLAPHSSRAAAPASAQQLVTEALQAELAGDVKLRAEKLAEALCVDPNNKEARWQSGFVQLDGQWIALSEVPARTKNDARLAAYRKQRASLIDTADNQREMARWCQKHHLPEQARVHWTKLLEFEPQDAEALTGLGLQLHEGRLLTREQIELHKKFAGEQLKATRTWQPKLLKWRRAIEGGPSKGAAEAMEALSKINDPLAIPAMEATFSVEGDSDKARVLNGVLIQTMGRFQVPEATQVLLRQALWGPTRDVACAELKKRPMHAYVPQLIAAMPDQLSGKYHVTLAANGTVFVEYSLLREGRETDYSLTGEHWLVTNASDEVIFGRAHLLAKGAGYLHQVSQRLSAISNVVGQHEQAQEEWRDRLRLVLRETTGFVNADDPKLLEQQWNDYNEQQPTQTPKRYQSTNEAGLVATVPSSVVTTLTSHSCFAAGTLVVTDRGSVPIESIMAGDQVLSQHPKSGELAYKTVQVTTLRAPTKIVSLSVMDEIIRTTRAHPFWVNGFGWRAAKFLVPGQQVHSLSGAASVDSLHDEQPREVYNLVVNGWHNYFVGHQRVLVHDNSPLQETPAVVPGLLSQTVRVANSSN